MAKILTPLLLAGEGDATKTPTYASGGQGFYSPAAAASSDC